MSTGAAHTSCYHQGVQGSELPPQPSFTEVAYACAQPTATSQTVCKWGPTNSGITVNVTLNTTGTFHYACQIPGHCQGGNMNLQVNVASCAPARLARWQPHSPHQCPAKVCGKKCFEVTRLVRQRSYFTPIHVLRFLASYGMTLDLLVRVATSSVGPAWPSLAPAHNGGTPGSLLVAVPVPCRISHDDQHL